MYIVKSSVAHRVIFGSITALWVFATFVHAPTARAQAQLAPPDVSLAIPELSFVASMPSPSSEACRVFEPGAAESPACAGIPVAEIIAQSSHPMAQVRSMWVFLSGESAVTVTVASVQLAPLRDSENIAEFEAGMLEGISGTPGTTIEVERDPSGRIASRSMTRGVPTIRLRALMRCQTPSPTCFDQRIVSTLYSGSSANVTVSITADAADPTAIESILARVDATVSLPVEANVRFDQPQANRMAYRAGQMTSYVCCFGIALAIPGFIFWKARKSRAATT